MPTPPTSGRIARPDIGAREAAEGVTEPSQSSFEATLGFLRLDAESCAALRRFRGSVENEIDRIVDEFYRRVMQVDELNAMLRDVPDIGRLKVAQREHWLRLFDATFDQRYEEKVRRIGEAHFRAGLSPKHYLMSYSTILEQLISLAMQRLGHDLTDARTTAMAICRATFLDVLVALDVYYDALRKERQSVEDNLRKAKEGAEAASRTKSSFLANMSHELRTPLNAVIGFSEILAGEMMGPLGSPKYKEYARNILDSGTHLLDIINDILDLSRVEAGKLELAYLWVDVAEVLASAKEWVEERAAVGGLVIEMRTGKDLQPIMADARILKQIVLNLLSNAVKFTLPGGRISIGAAPGEAGWVRLTVEDTGIGIPADRLGEVLEPFVQVENTMHRKFVGTGLGLPLVKSLTELHGGRFILESQVGRGTVATVLLPSLRTPS
jgi:signal transduction histidine kinase